MSGHRRIGVPVTHKMGSATVMIVADPITLAGPQFGIDRVYIDDVRLLGVGLPLQTESTGVTTSNASAQVAQASITSLLETARLQWQGLVQVPEGISGVALGQVGITASNLPLDKVPGTKLKEAENVWDASISKRSLNDQLFLTNANTVFALRSVDQQPATDESGLNSDASLTSDRHTIDTEPDAGLTERESTSLVRSVVNEDGSTEATVNEHGSAIGDRPISIFDFDVSADLPTPGGERAITELNVLNAEKLSFVLLQPLPGLIGQQNGLVGVPPLSSMVHPNWARTRIKITRLRFSIISPSVA